MDVLGTRLQPQMNEPGLPWTGFHRPQVIERKAENGNADAFGKGI